MYTGQKYLKIVYSVYKKEDSVERPGSETTDLRFICLYVSKFLKSGI